MPATTDRRNNVTWLHLSDFHLQRQKSGPDDGRALKTLCADLRRLQQEQGLRPDLIFFTGNAASHAAHADTGERLRQQLQDAHRLLEEVRNAFMPAVGRVNLFLVPGDQDARPVANGDPAVAWPDDDSGLTAVTQAIRAKDEIWYAQMERFAAYQDFLRRNGYTHLLADPDRLIYTAVRELHGVRVGIAGLNSAWASGGDPARGTIWFGGRWQLERLVSQLRNVDLAIALTHHPTDWFTTSERREVEPALRGAFAYHLHGHEPQGWVSTEAETQIRIAASIHENGYNMVRLDMGAGRGELWLRQYDRLGDGWGPAVTHDTADAAGRYEFPVQVPPAAASPGAFSAASPPSTTRPTTVAAPPGSAQWSALSRLDPPSLPAPTESATVATAAPAAKQTGRAHPLLHAGGLLGVALLVLGVLAMRGRNAPAPIPTRAEYQTRVQAFQVETDPFAFCSDSIFTWVEDAAERFDRSYGNVRTGIVPYGSRDGKQYILYKGNIIARGGKGLSYQAQGRPILYCPDDGYWLEKLNDDWRNPRLLAQNTDVVDTEAVRLLLHSRLVLIMHPRRGEQFRAEMARYPRRTWELVQRIARDGWPASGGGAAEPCRILMADPLKYHAGLATLALVFSEYERARPGALTSSPPFLCFLEPLGKAAQTVQANTPISPNASVSGLAATLSENEIAIGYEADLFTALKEKAAEDLQVVYPDPTVDIRFSAAALNGKWAAERREVGSAFVDYLLTPEIQNLALDHGFRPESRLAKAQRFAGTDAGFQVDVPTVKLSVGSQPSAVSDRPSVETTELVLTPRMTSDLVYQWSTIQGTATGRAPRANVGK